MRLVAMNVLAGKIFHHVTLKRNNLFPPLAVDQLIAARDEVFSVDISILYVSINSVRDVGDMLVYYEWEDPPLIFIQQGMLIKVTYQNVSTAIVTKY